MTGNSRQPTALIAEDEAMLRAQLRTRLAHAWPELAVVAEAENGEQALALQRELEPDIVFLDIRMPVRSGLEVAEALAGACHVVFVTAYDEYAVTAFEQGAVDYVLKPVTPERMAKVVQRLKDRLDRPPADLATVLAQLEAREGGGPLRWIKASLGASMRLIPVDEVHYFQAEDKYTKVVTGEGDALIRKTIKELFDELDSELFWQVHRGTIVNLQSDRAGRARLSRPAAHHPQAPTRETHRQPHLRAPLQGDVAPGAVGRTPAPGKIGVFSRRLSHAVPRMTLQATIEAAWERRAELSPAAAPAELREAVETAIAELDAGRLRVAEKTSGGWATHQWLKKAVLLSFRLRDSEPIGLAGPNVPFRFYDKVPTKFAQFDETAFAKAGVRVVPPAVARRGAYIARERRAHALLRQHRGLCRRRHDGRYLGHGRLLRADRQERTLVRRRRHRRGA